jgi:hypothetical protein
VTTTAINIEKTTSTAREAGCSSATWTIRRGEGSVLRLPPLRRESSWAVAGTFEANIPARSATARAGCPIDLRPWAAGSKKPIVSVPRATRPGTAWDPVKTGFARAPRPSAAGRSTCVRSTPRTDYGRQGRGARRELAGDQPQRVKLLNKAILPTSLLGDLGQGRQGGPAGREGTAALSVPQCVVIGGACSRVLGLIRPALP